jgi:DNA-binding NtrC family response regulator
MNKDRILVIEDEVPMLENYTRMLNKMGYECIAERESIKAIENLSTISPDVILTDLRMPGADGFDILENSRRVLPEIPVVLITAYATIPAAVEAVKKGAFDFIAKPVSSSHLKIVVERAVRHKKLSEENRKLREQVRLIQPYEIIGRSRAIQEVFHLIDRISVTDANILISGESGTGKELIARNIHLSSNRKEKPFVVVDCAAIPENLLESELFGYEKGAFTGAGKSKTGLFESADHGTLFLDEIGELPILLQTKLLRAIQEKSIRRIGSNKEIHLNVRIIAATNRDLKKDVEQKRFREDLYYRLNVINIHLPPLRERKGDIVLLAMHFLKNLSSVHGKNISSITPEALELLELYEWPGNVRQLQNVIERAVVLTNSDSIDPGILPGEIVKPWPGFKKSGDSLPYREAKERCLSDFETEYLKSLLSKTSGNITEAAKIAGVNRKTIHRLLKRYNINLDSTIKQGGIRE